MFVCGFFRYNQGKYYIHGLLVDRVEINLLLENCKCADRLVQALQSPVRNGDVLANTSTAYTFPFDE